MSLWLQHVLVLVLVATCVGVVGRQLIGTFRVTRGGRKLGSCCEKGCEPAPSQVGRAQTERIVFIPSSTLSRKP